MDGGLKCGQVLPKKTSVDESLGNPASTGPLHRDSWTPEDPVCLPCRHLTQATSKGRWIEQEN